MESVSRITSKSSDWVGSLVGSLVGAVFGSLLG
jgi:hypothetical protein